MKEFKMIELTDEVINSMFNMANDEFDGFKKIGEDYRYSLKSVYLYNTLTKQYKNVIVDDTEYQYGDGHISREYSMEQLEKLRSMEIDKEALRQYNKDNDIIDKESIIEVVKGRKYPKGTIGTVTEIKPYRDKYKRYITDYIFTDNGMKIDVRNVKRIERGE